MAENETSEERRVLVDGGELPKFDPTFKLEEWDTEEGPVVGVRYDGDDVPTPEQRVAYVRAAMQRDE